MIFSFSGIRNIYFTRPKRFPAFLQAFFDQYFDDNYGTCQFHTINMIIIAHPQIYNITKMGRKKTVVRDRVKNNQELRLKAPVLTVPEAMLAYGLKSRFFTFLVSTNWFKIVFLHFCA